MGSTGAEEWLDDAIATVIHSDSAKKHNQSALHQDAGTYLACAWCPGYQAEAYIYIHTRMKRCAWQANPPFKDSCKIRPGTSHIIKLCQNVYMSMHAFCWGVNA